MRLARRLLKFDFIRVATIDLLSRLLAQGLIIYLARSLGPKSYGILAVAVNSAGLLYILGDLGMGEAAVQQLTGTDAARRSFQTEWAPARRLTAVALTGCLCLCGVLLRHSADALPVILACLGITGYMEVQNEYLANRSSLNFTLSATAGAVLALIMYSGPVVMTLVSRKPTFVAFGAACSALVVGVPVGMRYQWRYRERIFCSFKQWASRARLGFPFLAITISVAAYTRVDRIFVEVAAGAKAAGLYTSAYSIVMGISMLGAIAQVLLYPRVAELMRSKAYTTYLKSLLLAVTGGFALALGTFFWRATIIRVLFGPSYVGAADLLGILAWTLPFYIVNPQLANALIGQRRQGKLARVALVNLAFALGAYAVASVQWGATGAALASILVEGLGCVQMVALLGRPAVFHRRG